MKPIVLTQLSFEGVRDSLDPSTAEPRKAQQLQNCYPVDRFLGAAVVGRPGFQQSGGTLVAGKSIQGIVQYSKLDATETTVAFVNGLMYKFNWSTRVWTNVALGGGAALSTTAKIDAITFANVLVVSDGVNTPFQWDGTTFTVLANCPVLYGPPTVYYAKLMGVTAANHTQFTWSQENDPTTGYTSGGFNNAWILGQTRQDAINRLIGTNAALYYFRERSCGYISGAVTTDFVSAGTREGVSETVGTKSPRAVVLYEQGLYFLSADGQPYVIQVGGGLHPLWADLRETVATFTRASLPSALGVADPLTQMVLLGVVDTNQDNPSLYIAIDTRTGLIGGLWDGFQSTAMAMTKDANLVPRIMHGTKNGAVYDHGDPAGSLWNDGNSTADGGTLAITHTVKGSPQGYDLQMEKIFDRVDISVRLQTNLTGVQIDYETPRGISTAQTLNFTGTFAEWDVAIWDTDLWPSDELEHHFALGWDGRGRWASTRIRHGYGTERFGLLGWTIIALPDGPDPGIP